MGTISTSFTCHNCELRWCRWVVCRSRETRWNFLKTVVRKPNGVDFVLYGRPGRSCDDFKQCVVRVKVRVQQSHYRPEQVLRIPVGRGSQISK